MLPNQLNDSSSFFGWIGMSSKNDDNQLVQALHEDFVHEVPKVGWGIGGGHG